MHDNTRLTWPLGLAAALLALAPPAPAEISSQPATAPGIMVKAQVQPGARVVKAQRKASSPDRGFDDGNTAVLGQDAASDCQEEAFKGTRHSTRPAGATPCAGSSTTPAPEITATGWTSYSNSRYGTSIRYPQSHFRPAGEPPANHDARRFTSPDGQAGMRVWAGHNALQRSITEMRTEILETHPAAKVLAQSHGNYGFTLKLKLGATILRRRSFVDDKNVVHNVEIRYPAARARHFDAVAEVVVKSLSHPLISAPAAPSPAEPGAPSAPAHPAARVTEQAFWESIRTSPHASDFQAYLKRWPGGPHARAARQRLTDLSPPRPPGPGDAQMERAFWRSIEHSEDPAMFRAYLDQWPDGTFAALARLKIQRLTEASAPPAPRPAVDFYTPARGTAERRAIMDAARVPMTRELGQRVIFQVSELRTDGTWCYLEAEPLNPDDSRLDWSASAYAQDWANDMMSDLVMVLLRRQGSGWHVIDYVIGPTDVYWHNWVDDHGLPEELFTPGY